MKRFRSSLLAVMGIVSIASLGYAQQRDTGRQGGTADAGAEPPAAQLKQLETMVGSWTVSGQCWEPDKSKTDTAKSEPAKAGQTPGAGESVTGTSNTRWVLGSRFLQCENTAQKGGKTIHGIGMTGYDTGKNKYVSTWQDDQCNSIKMEEGTYDAASKTFTFTGEGPDKDGKMVKCRRLVKVISDDEHTMTMFITEQGKSEMKIADLTFKRTSGAPMGSARP